MGLLESCLSVTVLLNTSCNIIQSEQWPVGERNSLEQVLTVNSRSSLPDCEWDWSPDRSSPVSQTATCPEAVLPPLICPLVPHSQSVASSN